MRFGKVNLNLFLGGTIVFIIIAVGALSLIYTPHDPNRMDLARRFQPPGGIHLLGTDQYGRDILSRLMEGAWNSLIVGAIAVGIGLTLGVLLGSLAA
ncbi:MAG: ABC transporter permease, partial [bacterium]